MIAKYMCRKFCADMCYIGTTSISTTPVIVYLQKQSENYVIGKALSRKRNVF